MNSPTRLLLAIDPGAAGGYAYRLGNSGVVTGPLPQHDGAMLDLLRELQTQADEVELYIEDVRSFAGDLGMAASMAKLFGGKRFIDGLAMGLGWRVVDVEPKKWQSHFAFGKKNKRTTSKGKIVNDETEWKNRLKSEAQKRFPQIKISLGTADALLILDYATHQTSKP